MRVVVARSRSIHGPWENAPNNPVVRTLDKREPWWSRGHATLIDTPDGRWHMVYHGYENGFMTLGRQTLLELRVSGGKFTQHRGETSQRVRPAHPIHQA